MGYCKFQDIRIAGLSSAVPLAKRNVAEAIAQFPDKNIQEQIVASGVSESRIAPADQTASDLGFVAAKVLLEDKQTDISAIGCIIFAALTPDYRSPATAAVLHHRLGLSIDCIAYDLVLGANGFVTGMQMASSVLATINKPYALLIVGDTNSKLFPALSPESLLYGDGCSAILLESFEKAGSFTISTNTHSAGLDAFLHEKGGFRIQPVMIDDQQAIHSNKAVLNALKVNRKELESFYFEVIPSALKDFVSRNNSSFNDFDCIALQQDSELVIKQIAESAGLDFGKLPLNLHSFGNTSGNAIPLLLTDILHGKNDSSLQVLACSFGEGLSYGIASFSIDPSVILPLIETEAVFSEGDVSHIF